MQWVKNQDYAARVTKTSDDEFGRLVDEYNHMLAEIQERDNLLRRHRDDLEHQVIIRTAELREKNAALEQAVAQAREAQMQARSGECRQVPIPRHYEP